MDNQKFNWKALLAPIVGALMAGFGAALTGEDTTPYAAGAGGAVGGFIGIFLDRFKPSGK